MNLKVTLAKGGMKVGGVDPLYILYEDSCFGITPRTFIPPLEPCETPSCRHFQTSTHRLLRSAASLGRD